MSSQPPGPYGPPPGGDPGPRRRVDPQQPSRETPPEITGYGSYDPRYRDYPAEAGHGADPRYVQRPGGYDPEGYVDYDDGYTYGQPEPLTRRGTPWLAVGLALVVIALLAVVAMFAVRALVTQAPDDLASGRPDSTPRSSAPVIPGAAEPSPGADATTAPPETTEPQTTEPSPSPSQSETSALPAGDRVCSPGVGAAGSASCPFANAIADAVRADPSAGSYDVFSPVTKRRYDVTCTGTELITCRGGANATVHVIP